MSATAKFVAAAVGAALVSSCETPGTLSTMYESACYRPLFDETAPADNLLANIEAVCAGAAARESSHHVDEIVNALINSGAAGRRLGHYEQAAASLRRAHALDANRQDASLELAWVLLNQHRHDESLNLINEVLRTLRPENSLHATAHYLRGLVLDDRHGEGDEDAALLDWQELVSDTFDEHPYAQDGRSRIVEVATRLGKVAMRAQTRDATESAIGYFVRAQNAAEAANWELRWPISFEIPSPPESPQSHPQPDSVDAAGIFMNLGNAKLQMAGLTSPSGVADFNCAAGVGTQDWLNRAQQDFESATQRAPDSDQAWRRLACADLALGRTDDAMAAASHAVAVPPPNNSSEFSEDYWMRARALAITGPVQAADDAFQAAATYATDTRKRASIHVERAALYYVDAETAQQFHPAGAPAQNEPSRAQIYLQQAVVEDPSNALAHLRLGIVYFDGRNYARANDELKRVADLGYPPSDLTNPAVTEHEDPTQHFGDRPIRAEALYYRSRLGTETQYAQDPAIGCPRRESNCRAIEFAKEAFRFNTAWRYREQACLARIRFLRVYDSDQGLNYCTTTGLAAPDAKAFLLQGMYHLARAHVAIGLIARRQAWDDADHSFSDGLRIVGAANDPAARLLRARLLQGHATAQYCVGLTNVGHELEASIAAQLPEQAVNAHNYFESYGIMLCPRGEH